MLSCAQRRVLRVWEYKRKEWVTGHEHHNKKGKLVNRSERWWRWSFGLLEEMRKIFAIVGTIISRIFRKQKNRFNVEVSLWRVKDKSHEGTLDVVLVRTKQRFRSRVAVQETAWNWRCTRLRVSWRNTLHVGCCCCCFCRWQNDRIHGDHSTNPTWVGCGEEWRKT